MTSAELDMAQAPPTRAEQVLAQPAAAALAVNWEKALWALLILAAFVTRFYILGARVMSHDESLHTYFSFNLYQGKGFQHTPLMHGPLKFHLTALSYWLMGDSDFSARVPTALFGVAAVALPLFFRRWLGRSGALSAGLLMLISPYMLYYSRYIRDEPMVIVWGLLMALATFRYSETRDGRWLYGMAAVTALFYTTMESSFIYVAIWLLFLGLYMVRDLFAAAWPLPAYKPAFMICVAGAFLTVLTAGVLYGLSLNPQILDPTAAFEPPPPAHEDSTAIGLPETPFSFPIAMAGALAGVFVLAGAALFLLGYRQEARRFAALDLIVLLWTFVMPQLTAFPVHWLGRDPLDYSTTGLIFTASVLAPLMLASIAIGVVWDWKKWLICAGIFYGIYLPFFTTIFTNGSGWATGLVGSLGYWLAQQGVRRGGQPGYYYLLVQVPLYEFLPALGALGAMGHTALRWLRAMTITEPLPDSEAAGPPALAKQAFPVIPFLCFWAVASPVAFSIAGEKMPWLTTHIALPFILLSGWYCGRMLDRTDWQTLRERGGWIAALLLPLFLAALVSALVQALGSAPPFRGRTLDELQATSNFLSALLVAVGSGAALIFAGRRLGWRPLAQLAGLGVLGLLAVLTARVALVSSFIRFDLATEYMVYAHGAPGVKTVMAQVEDISRRTSDDLGLRVAYDDDIAWPMTWYFRNYYNQVYFGSQPTREALDVPVVVAGDSTWAKVEPLLGDRYYSFEYIRMWWPMQEYFNLNGDRVRQALASPEWRQALWDIWWARDYTRYGQLTSTDYSLARWPVSDRMRLYVRKDIAAQIWDYGVGPTELSQTVAVDPFENLKQTRQADRFFGASGSAAGQFNFPRAAAVGPDGSLYVADTRNHRVQKFDAAGNFLTAWGAFGDVAQGAGGPAQFNEPWGIAVGPDGSVYVGDTWNHRVQKFDAAGQYLTSWGVFGTDLNNLYAMWGPRGVAVDSGGRVYVADTGNKRILVYSENGEALGQIGEPGSLAGQLDEPVGVAVDGQGRVYVADTWNRRVQVFSPDFTYLTEWPIEGWYGQSLDNKPYLAVDGVGRVYVSDPEGYRILVFTGDGQPLETFGDFGEDPFTFALPAGLAADSLGGLWVVDTNNHRLLRFPVVP